MASVYNLNVECENCGEVAQPNPPKNRLKWVLGMAIIFAGLGFMIGSVFGIATAGFGFVATVVTVPAGIYIGYKIGMVGSELLDGPSCPTCGSAHDSGLLPF